jgi:hypothetical protein
MRWKLLVIASLIAALLALGLWSALVIGAFGTARKLASHGWFLLASAMVPLAIAVYAGVFVYRHTSRRRKTQAVVTVIVALFLTVGAYVAAAQVFPDRLAIPPPRLNRAMTTKPTVALAALLAPNRFPFAPASRSRSRIEYVRRVRHPAQPRPDEYLPD